MSNICEHCGADIHHCADCDWYNKSFMEIPKGATNGDIIKDMFNVRIEDKFNRSIGIKLFYGEGDWDYLQFDKDFWNAPYKREEQSNVKS